MTTSSTFLRTSIAMDPFSLGDLGPEDVLRIQSVFPELFGGVCVSQSAAAGERSSAHCVLPVDSAATEGRVVAAPTDRRVAAPADRRVAPPTEIPVTCSRGRMCLGGSSRPPDKPRPPTTAAHSSTSKSIVKAKTEAGARIRAAPPPSDKTSPKPLQNGPPKFQPKSTKIPPLRREKVPDDGSEGASGDFAGVQVDRFEQLTLARALASKYERAGRLRRKPAKTATLPPHRTLILERIAADLVRQEVLRCMEHAATAQDDVIAPHAATAQDDVIAPHEPITAESASLLATPTLTAQPMGAVDLVATPRSGRSDATDCSELEDFVVTAGGSDVIGENRGVIAEKYANRDVIAEKYAKRDVIAEKYANRDVIAEFTNRDVIAEFTNRDVIAEFTNRDVIAEFTNRDVISENRDVIAEFTNRDVTSIHDVSENDVTTPTTWSKSLSLLASFAADLRTPELSIAAQAPTATTKSFPQLLLEFEATATARLKDLYAGVLSEGEAESAGLYVSSSGEDTPPLSEGEELLLDW